MTRLELKYCLVAVSLAGSLGFPINAATPGTDNNDNPYQIILERNPFNLKPPPPPPEPVKPVVPKEKGKVFFTGITALRRPIKAYFMLKGEKGKIDYYSLSEQQTKDGLEVLAINERERTVKIRNDGVEMLLTLAKDAPPATATSGGAPAAPGPIPPGGAIPPPQVGVNGMRVPQPVPMAAGQNGVAPGAITTTAAAQNAAGYVGSRGIPTRNIRGGYQMDPGMAARYGVNPAPQAAPGGAPVLTPEEQVLMLEAQKAANPAIPFPPTPGLPGDQHPGQTVRPLPPLPGRP